MFPDLDFPASVQTLILVVAFFMPGFIAGKVFELCFPRLEVSEKVRLLEFVTLSSVNYAIWSWLIVVSFQNRLWETTPNWFACYVVVILLVSPVLIGVLLAVATEKNWFPRIVRQLGVRAPHHLGTAWEWFFRRSLSRRWWVIIRLRSGIMVYGFYGWNSYMGNERGQRDLYLEAECKLSNDSRLQILDDTGGVYVRYEDIEAVAFRWVNPTKDNDSD